MRKKSVCALKDEMALCGRAKEIKTGIVSGPKKCTLRFAQCLNEDWTVCKYYNFSGVDFDFDKCKGRSACKVKGNKYPKKKKKGRKEGKIDEDDDGAPFDKKKCYSYGKTLCK